MIIKKISIFSFFNNNFYYFINKTKLLNQDIKLFLFQFKT